MARPICGHTGRVGEGVEDGVGGGSDRLPDPCSSERAPVYRGEVPRLSTVMIATRTLGVRYRRSGCGSAEPGRYADLRTSKCARGLMPVPGGPPMIEP